MRSAAECREHAKACRSLAKGFDGNRRNHTLRMAETWENLARQVEAANTRYLMDMLKASYDQVCQEPVPEIFRGLLKHLETADLRVREYVRRRTRRT